MSSKTFRIAEFIINTNTRQLIKNGRPLPISSRAFDILECLIENREKVVEKSHILASVWPDSFVEENNLPVHISAIRRVFGETRGESSFIKTISGRGYCLVAPVEEVDPSSGSSRLAPNMADSSEASSPVSIAVLPFTFEPNTPELEYLALGLTQSLIDDLSQVDGLKVFAYSAVRNYRDSNQRPSDIGFLLGADNILTGFISNHADRSHISAELVNAADSSYVWGTHQGIDPDDLFRLKREISQSVAENLKLKVNQSKTGVGTTNEEPNYEAQKLYFRGMDVLESRSYTPNTENVFSQALKFFRQAAAIDPNFALAFVGIGMAYVSMYNYNLLEKEKAISEAENSVRKALIADDRVSQAYVLKASIDSMIKHNFIASSRSVDRAIELNPNNADAFHWKAFNYKCLGKFEEALAAETQASQFDPTSMRFNSSLMRIHFFSGDYHKAITIAQELLEFKPNNVDSLLLLSQSQAQLGLLDLALGSIEMAIETRPIPELILTKAFVLGLSGDRRGAEKIVGEVVKSFPKAQIDSTDLAHVYSVLGETDRAFELLEEAFLNGGSSLIILKIDPRSKGLHHDTRFEPFLRRLNLL